MKVVIKLTVIPAKEGNHSEMACSSGLWIPAFAGMTGYIFRSEAVATSVSLDVEAAFPDHGCMQRRPIHARSNADIAQCLHYAGFHSLEAADINIGIAFQQCRDCLASFPDLVLDVSARLVLYA